MTIPRDVNDKLQERIRIPFDHAALTATGTVKISKPPRAYVLESVQYINPTGLAADGTNAFSGKIQIGGVDAATLFNTDSGDTGGAALPANTFVEGELAAAVNGDADEEITFVATLEGTQTLPVGRGELWIRLL